MHLFNKPLFILKTLFSGLQLMDPVSLGVAAGGVILSVLVRPSTPPCHCHCSFAVGDTSSGTGWFWLLGLALGVFLAGVVCGRWLSLFQTPGSATLPPPPPKGRGRGILSLPSSASP